MLELHCRWNVSKKWLTGKNRLRLFIVGSINAERWPLTSRPTLLVVSTDCATHRNAASNTLVLVEVSWTVLSTKNHAQAQDKAFTWLKGSSYYAPHATMYWKFRNRRVSQSMWADIDRPVCSQNRTLILIFPYSYSNIPLLGGEWPSIWTVPRPVQCSQTSGRKVSRTPHATSITSG